MKHLLVSTTFLLLLGATTASLPAVAQVTCKLVTDTTTSGMRPRCPCASYQVDCGNGRVGWVGNGGNVTDKSGGNITFSTDSIDLYDDRETFSSKKVATVAGTPCTPDPTKATAEGEASAFSKIASCNANNRIIAYPELNNCAKDGWRACVYHSGTVGDGSAFSKCTGDPSLSLSTPTAIPTVAYEPKPGYVITYEASTMKILTVNTAAAHLSCTQTTVKICVGNAHAFKKAPDGSLQDIGIGSRIACAAVGDGCPEAAICANDSLAFDKVAQTDHFDGATGATTPPNKSGATQATPH